MVLCRYRLVSREPIEQVQGQSSASVIAKLIIHRRAVLESQRNRKPTVQAVRQCHRVGFILNFGHGASSIHMNTGRARSRHPIWDFFKHISAAPQTVATVCVGKTVERFCSFSMCRLDERLTLCAFRLQIIQRIRFVDFECYSVNFSHFKPPRLVWSGVGCAAIASGPAFLPWPNRPRAWRYSSCHASICNE